MPEFSIVDIVRNLDASIRFLENNHVRYMLTGAVALGVWGRPRATLDVDFFIQVDAMGLAQLEKTASASKFKIDYQFLNVNPLLRKLQLRLRFGQVMIDLMIPRDEHDVHAFSRKKQRKVGRRLYWFISPEDFIIQKLKVGRPRDFEVDSRNMNLFMGYMEITICEMLRV